MQRTGNKESFSRNVVDVWRIPVLTSRPGYEALLSPEERLHV
jgi:hypothetical protein